MAQGGSGVISDPETVLEAYKQVRSDENDTLWLALEYDDKSIVPKENATGTDYNELLALFKEDQRMYAYCKFIAGDEMSKRAKFVLITWIGSAVSPLKKAKVSTDKAFVKELIKEFSLEILADDLADLAYEKVLERVVLSSGAKY